MDNREHVMKPSEDQHSGSESGVAGGFCPHSQEYKEPPHVCFEQKNAGDLPESTETWSNDHLPIDIILLTVENCDFFSCFSLLDKPFKSYKKEIGYVYFGGIGDTSDQEKLKIALVKCHKGPATPGGSLAAILNAVRVLRPKAVFSVGTCISLDLENVKMGDVVISCKLTAEGFRTPVSRLLSRLIRDASLGWVAPLRNPDEMEVKVHCDGDILSQSQRENCRCDDIWEQYPGAVAIETEGIDLYAAGCDASIEWVIVKGVASYFHQSQAATSEWMSFASTMAASVVAKMLKDPTVFREWPHYNQGVRYGTSDDQHSMQQYGAFDVTEGKGCKKAIDEEEKQYGGNGGKDYGRGAEDKHRTILRDYRSKIVMDLEPNNILPNLGRLLNEMDEVEIKAQSTRRERCEKLLEILPRKGPNAFKVFVEALEGEAPHLVLDLIHTEREYEKTTEEDLSHRIRELQMEEKEEPDKVAIFAGTLTSEGFHLDLNEGAIHLTFPPDSVAEPTDIMVYRWKYGICLPQLEEHEAIVSNVIEISADKEVGGLKFNSEVKLVLSHSAADLEGYELVMKRLTDTEKNEWQEIAGCEDIRQVSDSDDYSCPNNVPYSFPVVIANITKCSTYAVVSRLKSSPAYNITVSGGTFVHPGYPQVTITAPQEAVESETRLSLQLKVQEVPQNEFQSHSLFYGPILRVVCCSRVTFLQPVTIQLPISLGNKPVNIPQPSECRVRIFFLSSEREPKEWIEISDKLETPASYDGKLVKFKVQRFSGYFCLLEWSHQSGVPPIAIIDYLTRIMSNQPQVATFFAYFDPKERQGSRDILFLICSPAHRSKDVKQELEKAGLKPREATSRRDMIPGHDKAFAFVSDGISFACSEDMAGGFYLRFDGNVPHKGHLQVLRIGGKVHCKVEFRDTPDTDGNNNLLSKLTLRSSSPNIDRQDSSSSNESVSPFPPEGWSVSNSSRKLKVTLLSSEWGSTKGGLSTINRELAIQLAKDDNMEVCMYLPAFSDEDKKVADKCRVRLLKAKEKPGYNPIDWLASVPSDHQMEVVIGHGIHLGRQVSHIKESHPECKWIQVVHTDPEELSMFKTYDGPTAKGAKKREAEVKLCQEADQVVAIGPKLADTCSHSCGKGKVLVLTPGIFSEFANVNQSTEERNVFHVLVFGRGDIEDFQIKGYDIAAQAVAALKDEKDTFKLVFVGAPNGKEEEVKKMLLEEGILPQQLIVRIEKEREQLAQEFYGADLVIMPSRAEGFGLAALEALSASLPVLISSNSGLAQALKKVDFGSHFVVNSDKPIEWAKAIREVRMKDRTNRLREARKLRKSYSKTYKWEEQCSRLIERIHELVADKPENEHANVEEEIRQLRTERDNMKERCEILAKQLEEVQVVGDSRKQPTTSFQDRATCPRELRCKGIYVYKNDFDKNGVVYALKNKLGGMNPSRKRIIATRSSDERGTASVVLENHLERGLVSATKAKENSWWCVDLTENYALYLTHYTLRHGQEQRGSFLCNWRLEGSVDGRKWATLKNHYNDRRLADCKTDSSYCTCTWAIDGHCNAFRYFRILQTGKNNSGRFGIFLSGIELYGVLVEIDS